MYYHATVKSNTLPLNNSGTHIIIVLLVLFHFLHTVLIFELNKLTSRLIMISLGPWYLCIIRYFFEILFLQMNVITI